MCDRPYEVFLRVCYQDLIAIPSETQLVHVGLHPLPWPSEEFLLLLTLRNRHTGLALSHKLFLGQHRGERLPRLARGRLRNPQPETDTQDLTGDSYPSLGYR